MNEYEAAVENYKEIVNDTMHEHCLHETHSSDGAHGLRIHDGLFQYYDGQGWVDTKVGAFEGQKQYVEKSSGIAVCRHHARGKSFRKQLFQNSRKKEIPVQAH